MANQSMIDVKNLTKYYGSNVGIKDLNFTVEKGEISGFLGLNGAGKTTTLKILACFLAPSSGTATIDGCEIFDKPLEIKRKIGYLPQEMPLYYDMTVKDYLYFISRIKGVDSKIAKKQVDEVIKKTDIHNYRDAIIKELSHGYQKRVGISQALITSPPVLILDEPFSGLDPSQIIEMRDIIGTLKGEHTILLSSHMLPQIESICDEILVIYNGKIIAEDKAENLSKKLNPNTIVNVEVRAEQDEVQKFLEKQDYIDSIKEIRSNKDITLFTVQLKSSQEDMETLAKQIVKAKFGIRKLAPAQSELENIFIGLTQGIKTSGGRN